ncbi:MAG TPA: hypothetical protein DCQ31_11140 [Bacteroidales bacterium]|nr:hypothetical protein [Bacteroidales bacterium]
MKKIELASPVLFVIDNSILLELNQLLNEKYKFEILQFSDAQYAWQALAESIPDVILTEIDLPKLNGVEFCRKIKRNILFKNIPVIFYSIHDNIDRKVEAFEAGADDYWVKPLSATELWLRLQVHVKRTQNHKQFVGNLLKNNKLNSLDDALHTGETSMRLILDYTFSWEVYTDTSDRIIYSSPYFETITGYRNADFIANKIGLIDLVEPADYGKLIFQIKTCKQSLKPLYSHEFRIITVSCEKKYLEIAIIPVINDENKCIGYRYSLKDITERKIAELLLNATQEELFEIKEDLEHLVEARTYDLKLLNKELVDNRKLLNVFLDYSSAWEVYRDIHGKIIFINNAVEKILNCSQNDYLEGKIHILDFVHPHDKNMVAELYLKAMAGYEIEDFEFRIVGNKNVLKYLAISVKQVYDENKVRLGFRSSITDKTDERQARDLAKKLQKAVESALSSIFILNQKGEFEYVNPYFISQISLDYHDIIGQTIEKFRAKIVTSDDYQTINKTLGSGSKWTGELRRTKPDGEKIIEQVVISPVFNAFDEVVNFVGVTTDISLQKEMDQKILKIVLQTEENERKVFAQELHDGLGPILVVAKHYTEWLLENEQDAENIKIIEKTVKMLSEATSTMRKISFNISPYLLQEFGFYFALKSFTEKVSESSKMDFVLTFKNENKFKPSIEVIVYRALTECINNTLKHAGATVIEIAIIQTDNRLIINYKDNGKGFDIESVWFNNKGIGLFNLKNRINAVNGVLCIDSNAEIGTVINIEINEIRE